MSVTVNNPVGFGSADSSELVRAQRGVVAPDACTTRVSNAKREHSATKGTIEGHASDGVVAFRGEAGELKLETCVLSGAALRGDGVSDIRNDVTSACVRARQ